MRVISMVPSWTETLIEAGINVVGRTRFCIHPENKVSDIPIVGGTKDANWNLIVDLKPDVVILDQEENPLVMAEECPVPYVATHVKDLESLQKCLVELGERFENAFLIERAVDALDILESPALVWNPSKVPGEIERFGANIPSTDQVTYLIWKKPWMSAGRETYIAAVLEKLGAKILEIYPDEKYPVLEDGDLSEGMCLFSSEPFPFLKKKADLLQEGLSGVIVDGECFSWFGVRSLEFLKKALQGSY